MRVVLSSNASLANYPDNTLTEFTVQLPSTLDLSKSPFEVGLSEIQFFKSWYNVKTTWLKIKRDNTEYRIIIPEGYYKSQEQLTKKINSSIKDLPTQEDFTKDIKFEVNQINKKVIIKRAMYASYSLHFDEQLADILGLEQPTLSQLATQNESTDFNGYAVYTASHANRLITIHNIYIYTDILQPNIVSDVEAPLLRAVAVESGHWKFQCSSYNKIQYLPLAQKQIRKISVYLRDDQGNPIPFTSGRTALTLDFRRVKSMHTY